MKKSFSCLLFLSSCSFMMNHKEPIYNNNQLIVDSCRQSNMPAGVDLIGSFISFVSLTSVANDNDPNSVLVVSAAASIFTASMIYGFIQSADCRDEHVLFGYESHGNRDWVIPPLVAITIGAFALSKNKKLDPFIINLDLCGVGAVATAICKDGTKSCSQNRIGTCSHHGGVALWL